MHDVTHREFLIWTGSLLTLASFGRIVEGGTYRDLVSGSGLYRKLYGRQFTGAGA
ncbi:MAG: hypothetical protein ACFB50_01215 [Rubrobacteraceae bacterium]